MWGSWIQRSRDRTPITSSSGLVRQAGAAPKASSPSTRARLCRVRALETRSSLTGATPNTTPRAAATTKKAPANQLLRRRKPWSHPRHLNQQNTSGTPIEQMWADHYLKQQWRNKHLQSARGSVVENSLPYITVKTYISRKALKKRSIIRKNKIVHIFRHTSARRTEIGIVLVSPDTGWPSSSYKSSFSFWISGRAVPQAADSTCTDTA